MRIISLLFTLLIFSVFHSQKLLWEKSLGGKHSEYLFDVKATPDYGFILAGSSLSDKTGNKEEDGKGNLDFLLWKLDENGNSEWQKSFGTNGADYLYSVNLTKDGGYILGGSSELMENDKVPFGDLGTFGLEDYVVMKLNAKGVVEWERRIGGKGQDKLVSIQETTDGGYILGGTSDSEPIVENPSKNSTKNKEIPTEIVKTSASFGNSDYWLIKLDKEGKLIWEKTYGGFFNDVLRIIKQTEDKGFIIGGYSNSPKYENSESKDLGAKQSECKGEGDFWIIKIDEYGKEEWQESLGSKGNDELFDIIPTEKGYLLGGTTASPPRNNVSDGLIDFLVMEIENTGKKIWENTYHISDRNILQRISSLKNTKNETEYLLCGYISGNQNDEQTVSDGGDYFVMKIDAKGEKQWEKKYEGKGNDLLNTAVETRDGGYVLAGTSDSQGKGQYDFYILKLLDTEKLANTNTRKMEVYPNPTEQFVNVIILFSDNQPQTTNSIKVLDINGSLLQEIKIQNSTTAVNLSGYQTGVYLFQITTDKGTEVVKVLKKGNR